MTADGADASEAGPASDAATDGVGDAVTDAPTDTEPDATDDSALDALPDTAMDTAADVPGDTEPDAVRDAVTDTPITDACAKVTCSGHGSCILVEGAPFCVCDPSYGHGPSPETCVPNCTPTCAVGVCGSDGCGGLCGECDSLVCGPSSCDGCDSCGGGHVCYLDHCACASAPTPVLIVAEGQEVIPQTRLHLVGSQSHAPEAEIVKYEWTVQQPPGSASVFVPATTAPDPTFEVNVAGEYVFGLKVWDSSGNPGCQITTAHVFVVPDEAIHVELLWDTPGDEDQTDEGPEAGADLDLHFAHPFASGMDGDGDGTPDPWFAVPHDCYWFNADPKWGSANPGVYDDPRLDRDDTDGAGPENLNLAAPEPSRTYRVGVHYWSDHDFGPSVATVRVYLYSQLSFESSQQLVNDALWEAATVTVSSAGDLSVKAVTSAGGGPKITPNYPTPFPPE
ncbi:MAG: hypothetical protein H6744_09615 [Deltaproteobacteria bacterium]|nr:hypothetical protein [Deltaproteobacteria bacterium]